jgi:cell division protein FtsW
MIFNASVYIAGLVFEDQAYFLKLQLIWVFFGIIAGTIVYFIDYHKIIKLITPILLLNILLLILVLIYGEEINGAKRWFDIGGVRIQPAEFIKPTLIIFLAALLAKFNNIKETSTAHAYREAKKKLATFLFVLLFVSVLIMLGPDMGTTIVICLTALALFFLSSTSTIQTIGTVLTTVILALVGVIAVVMEPYRLERISTYFQLLLHGEVADPRGTGYQLHQILIGIGSSGFWAKDLDNPGKDLAI